MTARLALVAIASCSDPVSAKPELREAAFAAARTCNEADESLGSAMQLATANLDRNLAANRPRAIETLTSVVLPVITTRQAACSHAKTMLELLVAKSPVLDTFALARLPLASAHLARLDALEQRVIALRGAAQGGASDDALQGQLAQLRMLVRNEPPRVEAPVAAVRSEPARVAAPRTLDDALGALRAKDLGGAADVIAKRVAQRAPKMRLTTDQALAAATALLALADRDAIRALHATMPRSTVELARATTERSVAVDEAERIARYLASVVAVVRFDRLHVFDENHSHVTGRQWHEIDYSGEGMTWQQQQADWSKQGVDDFKTARSIHAYFVGAEKLPHWKRVYRPRGVMADVAAPD